MKGVFLGIVVMGMMTSAGIMTVKAVDSQSRIDCQRLQDESKTQPKWDEARQVGFYITAAEKQMCDEVGIPVDAHVI